MQNWKDPLEILLKVMFDIFLLLCFSKLEESTFEIGVEMWPLYVILQNVFKKGGPEASSENACRPI